MASQGNPKGRPNFALPLPKVASTQQRPFALTDIPAAMDSLGWTQGARFMRRWFNGSPYVMPRDVKLNRVDDRQLNRAHILDDLPFDWLLTSTERVKPVVDELIEEFSEINEYSGRVGRLKNMLDQLSPGLVRLMWRLEGLGLLDAAKKKLVNGTRFFGDRPAIQLEYTTQFNFTTVGTSLWEKATDSLDDVYGALGAFAIQIAVTQISTHSSHAGFPAIMIDEIGLYVRDTYEFRNESSDDDQLLGYWGPKGVLRPSLWNYVREPAHIDSNGSRYLRFTNDSFNNHRRTQNKGGDFVVYSTVKRVPVSIMLHLNDADFLEYLDKRPKSR
ncbi:DUF6402 family protein [Archangium sp.]|uniref:DUF6402 family protein n=1 Tax=Archangium sp. TaxID=1872627 RepID=UPI00286AB863|nr:DUF6402 family protein [Archangium sp.]